MVLRTHRPGGRTVVVHVRGDVDAAAAERFGEVLYQRVASTAWRVVLDVSEVSLLSSAAVLQLLRDQIHAQNRRTQLVLISENRHVDRVLSLLTVAERFAYAPNLPAALAGSADRRRVHARIPRQTRHRPA